jgi:hypothetical protein
MPTASSTCARLLHDITPNVSIEQLNSPNMFHKPWRPVPRPRVSALVQQYEDLTAAASPPSTPPRTSLESNAHSTRRNSYILDSVPEDPSDADDYMIPHVGAASPYEIPDSPRSPRNRRSLPRMNYSAPAVIVPDIDTPMPDCWSAPYGQVSPKTLPTWPTPAEVQAEDARVKKLAEQAEQRQSGLNAAKRFLRRSAVAVRKIAGKHRIRLHKRSTSPRGSEDTFDLRTPKRKLESQPSVKSRAKRVARGAVHSLVHLPTTSVDAVEIVQEATVNTAKTMHKSASRTHMRVVSRVEDAKDKVSTSLPIVRPPRSRYSPIGGNPDHYGRPLIQDTHTTPGSRPWPVLDDLNEPPVAGIIPPPPSPVNIRRRKRLQKQRPSSYPPSSPKRIQIPSASSSENLLYKPPPADAIFAQALVSDVQWQAQDALFPMIIVTDGADSHEGSWYLPLNSAGQIQLCYSSGSRTPSSSVSSSPRSSVDSTSSSIFAHSKKWYNGRSSFSSTRSTSAFEVNLRGTDDRSLEQVLVSYTDRTPLLVEFLSAEELEQRSGSVSNGQRKAVLWAPWEVCFFEGDRWNSSRRIFRIPRYFA